MGARAAPPYSRRFHRVWGQGRDHENDDRGEREDLGDDEIDEQRAEEVALFTALDRLAAGRACRPGAQPRLEQAGSPAARAVQSDCPTEHEEQMLHGQV